MSRDLLTPKWLVAHVVILAIASAFVLLGLWQLDRHQERLESNAVAAARLNQPAVPLDELLAEASGDLGSIEYRRALIVGTFNPSDEVLIRSQIHLGAGGYHVVTPLETNGGAVLVNRGWVPVILDQVPVGQAMPESGVVEVEGWVQTSRQRGFGGPADPEVGRLVIMNRVDIPRIQDQVDAELAPVYLVMTGGGEGLPEEVRLPTFEDSGPHLAYAIQWFGFALVGLVGYLFLARKRVGQKARSSTTSKPSTPMS